MFQFVIKHKDLLFGPKTLAQNLFREYHTSQFKDFKRL